MKMKLTYQRLTKDDWREAWKIIRPVFEAGETYPVAQDISENDASLYWLQPPKTSYAARNENGLIVGLYYIRPNQPALGAHVCNCGYIVAESMRGLGIASQLCQHSQSEARSLGYSAMQYNLVVSTNEAAIHVWQKNGLRIIGTIPKAFNHPQLGFVDAHIMFRLLSP